jgi:microcystin-dependent protein
MADSSANATAIEKLADQLSTSGDRPLTMRFATITAVDAGAGGKVQTSETGTGWVSRSEDTFLHVGDRVWLLQYSSVWIVGGRLSGESSANPIGAIMPFAGSTAPAGWAVCDGSAISRTDYPVAFATMGTAYGTGDGSTTFNLPDLRGKFPLGVSASHAQATTGGAETATLTVANLPAHDHGGVGDHTHTVQSYVTDNRSKTADLFGTLLPTPSGSNTSSANGGHTHSSVGSGTAHNNMPPYLSLPYIVRIL